MNGQTTTYTLDTSTSLSAGLHAGLTQVLDDGEYTYTCGIGRISQQNGSTTEYFLADALGSVRQMTDAAGAVTLTKSYTPYGEVLSSAGDGASAYGFTGEWTDVTGLVYLRARYYAPWQGRFFQQDPWNGNISVPSTFNPYQYGLSNPVRYTDPSGKNPLAVVGAFALAIGIGAGGGALYGCLTYEWAVSGLCGCELQQQALSMTKTDWIGMHALTGAVVAGILSLSAVTPGTFVIASGLLVAVSVYDLVQTFDVVYTEGIGWNKCTIARVAVDVAGIIFGSVGIVKGVRAWRASGSWLKWAKSPQVLNTPLSLYTTDLRGLYGATAEQIRQVIPKDWTVEYSPRPGYEQWVLTSPDGLEQVRIHQPIRNPNGPWQVRWGIKDVGQIPPQYKALEAPPNNFDPNYWLYFDRYGQPRMYTSEAVHEQFTVNVTLEDMMRVFGR